jgi:hypothetical protein
MLFSNMPVGFVMGAVGFLGFSYIRGFGPGLSIVVKDIFEVFSSYGLTVVPLFVFIGKVSFFQASANDFMPFQNTRPSGTG